VPESDSEITWDIRSGTGGELSSKKGVSTTFTSNEANSEVTISAQYKDPKSGNVSVKTITLYVKSDEDETKSYKLEIYDSPDDPGSITPASSHKTITVGEECTLYGHIFDDKTEEWISEYDELITWEITESKNTGLSSTEGVSTTFKSSEPNSEVTITARFIDPVSRKDIKKSIQITVKEKESYELRLYNTSGDPKDLKQVDYSKKVTIVVGEEYTLYGHIFDEAGEWVSKYDSLITWEATKSKNLGLTLVKGKKTIFISTEPNSEVTITARFKDRSSGKESVKSVKLFIDQKAVPSYAIKLYDSPGDPGNLKPVSSEITVTAGDAVTIYGHVFDKDGEWYKDHDKSISWKLKDVEEEGIKLEKSEGEYTSVTLTKTGTVRIVAEFVDNSNPAKPVSRAEVSVTVKPAAAYKVDIQKSKSDTLNTDQYNFDLLVFEKNVSIDSLYGIVRDKFGNFVRYADNASWKSGDIAVVKLIKSEGLLGIAEQQKNGVGSETIIIVSEKGLIPDTIKVSSVGEQSVVAYTIKPGQRIPQTVRNYYNKLFTSAGNIQKGTIVAIETPRPLLPDSTRDNSFGKVVVYDAVGNVVRADLKLVPAGSSTEEKRTYGILWDYTNRNKRQVGQGAYLFVVSGRYLDSNNRAVSFNEQVKVAAITK
ncbi:MAG: hypothetical protein Q4F84_06375, partial [Fibrobacter sp.]|nr:hypothetical protein [Fibrobacter sp.]